MVLGYILYETVDLGISAIKLTYNGMRATYYWWYDMDYPEIAQSKVQIKELEDLNKKMEVVNATLEELNTTTTLSK